MASSDEISATPMAQGSALSFLRSLPFRITGSRWAYALCSIVALSLSGCGSGNGAGSFIVDPGHYDAYHCKDLDARAKVLVTREKELRSLMDKASEGGGGAVIGALSYRTDYESVLTEEKLVQREQVEKKCAQPTTGFQSDQMIR